MPKRAFVIAATVIAALAVVIVLLSTGDGEKPSAATLTVPVDGLDSGASDDRSITVPQAAVTQAAHRLEDNLNATPPGTPQQQIDAASAAAKRIASEQSALPTAGATAGFQGCRTSFVNNQSSRRGVRPQWQALHYTVSPNRPGWSDVDAIVALFNRSSSQASSHFIIDAEGHCAYIVPIEAKAWTQAAANPFSVSYEIIATGREATYLSPAGFARLRSVVDQVARRTGIPLRRGLTNSCAPGRSGIVQHKDFGICGGGHVDVQPFNFAAIVSVLTKPTSAPVTRANRITCGKINAWRRAGRPRGGDWERNSKARIANLAKQRVTCTTKGARRS